MVVGIGFLGVGKMFDNVRQRVGLLRDALLSMYSERCHLLHVCPHACPSVLFCLKGARN